MERMIKNSLVSPILKWAGGKRQLLPEIEKHIPESFGRYYEPFFGGGALLFELQIKDAVINDINEDLMNTYIVIRDKSQELITLLASYPNNSDFFYRLREKDRDPEEYSKMSDVEKAARLIFLNKTCYNGLFRVNSQGQFNVSFGHFLKPNYANAQAITAVSNFFNESKTDIRCGDFEVALADAKKGDFVYLDPPYDPVSKTSSFVAYGKNGFGRDEQRRLHEVCVELDRKGVKFLISNSDTDFIKDLYKDFEKGISIVTARRSINRFRKGRGEINELLIQNISYEMNKEGQQITLF